MEFSSDPDNVLDGIIDGIWNKLKRKTNSSSAYPSIKKSNINNLTESETEVTKQISATQTDNVALVDFVNTLMRFVSCNVCRDLCQEALQCKNGHLICSDCCSKIADDWTTLCPVCRIPLQDNVTRSLIVEHLINEIPERCSRCSEIMPKSLLKSHEMYNCNKRLVNCKFSLGGCKWRHSNENLNLHESTCQYRSKTIGECYNDIQKQMLKIRKDNCYGSNILKLLANKLKQNQATLNMCVNKLSLSFINIESNNDENTLVYGNKCSRNGFKTKIRINLKQDSVEMSYSVYTNKFITGKYSFFIDKIKVNYIEFDVEDSLRNYLFTESENWTNWYSLELLNGLDKFRDTVNNINGKSIHVNLFTVSEMESADSRVKLSDQAQQRERWSSLIQHLRIHHGHHHDMNFIGLQRNNTRLQDTDTENQVHSGDIIDVNSEIVPTDNDPILQWTPNNELPEAVENTIATGDDD